MKDLKLTSQQIRQDISIAEKFIGSPCSWCNKKSIMRIRMMPSTIDGKEFDYSEMQIVSACDLHVKDFKNLLWRTKL